MNENNPLPNHEELWRIVNARDRSWSGRFVFGVSSTGIFCRPGCPARMPLRRNVTFFTTAFEAEAAGFRACKRCRPLEFEPAEAKLARRACALLEEHMEENLNLEDLASRLELSPSHFQRTFTRVIGLSPKQYADALRTEKLKRELRSGDSVTDALYAAGYGSSSRVYEKANQRLGMTPATYRRGGEGARIAYSLVTSSLGTVLVARTARGVCAIKIGDDPARLRAELEAEFPLADIREEAEECRYVEAILRHLEGATPYELSLPLDVRATAFQWRVWNLIKGIPYGATRSYGDLARELGNPGASRAVARACATNPVALAIPCHRVVPADGGEGGYRWGIERKHRLLEQEHDRADAALEPAG